MASTHNPILARLHQMRAVLTRQRPVDFERRLKRDVLARARGDLLRPSDAWHLYCRSMNRPCFADCGWLVEYGVFSFHGPETFQLGLVRQFDVLEHWNDEFVQLHLEVRHEPTPRLRALGRWNHWSFDHRSLTEFQTHCEQIQGVKEVLSDTSDSWTWSLWYDET